ncbi:MAG: sigma-54 dependent transcriptional regulator [Syntrophales bacterium LBB04]|nr:sigma-54 dependent transcriptional regulator [Syntrophales bacterium LBB04]
MANILIIDDDKLICEVLTSFSHSLGHSASYALSLQEGIRKIALENFDLLFLDVRLPDGNGLSIVPVVRETPACPEIIIITGEGSHKGAKIAMESGCWDYIEKPLSIETLKLPFLRAIQYRKEKANPKRSLFLKREGIIGESNLLKECLNLVAKAGVTDTNVLISGETGTGKELFAKAIHDNSLRAEKPFVVVDCATLPDSLVESTLFGHIKGTFTGADRNRVGLIKEADGGTLFLDEVGDLPLPIQPAFLRVLQEHRFRPVGEGREVESNFRLLAATNRNLDQMVLEGKFRGDLLFRIKSLVIQLPPLRDRSTDILDLALYYLKRFSERYGMGIKGLSPEICEALSGYAWPGNVRELANTMDTILSVARDEPTLYPIHLPPDIRSALKIASINERLLDIAPAGERDPSPASFKNLQDLIETTEKNYFADLIAFTGGDLKAICRISGLARSNVYNRMKKYGLSIHT